MQTTAMSRGVSFPSLLSFGESTNLFRSHRAVELPDQLGTRVSARRVRTVCRIEGGACQSGQEKRRRIEQS